MNLLEIYERMKKSGYVMSQYDFDRQWLGRPLGHTAYIKAVKSDASIETFFRLYIRLLEHGDKEYKLGIKTHHLHDIAEDVFEDMCNRVND